MHQDGVAMSYAIGNPFAIDWKDKDVVIALAKKLGKGQTVFKNPSNVFYSITHTERIDLYDDDWVVCQT